MTNRKADETFVIINPMTMHTEAMRENRSCKTTWEMYFRSELLTERQYSLVTRMMHTYPVKKKTSIILPQAFPVLEHATMAETDPTFLPQRVHLKELGNVHLQFCKAFDTVQHNRVFLVGISFLPHTLNSKNCSLKIGRLIPSYNDDYTLSMSNQGHIADMYMFMVTLVIPFTGCNRCSHFGKSDDTHPHMRRCGRCWKNLHFPIWYCDEECQRLDYERHRRCDGCMEVIKF
jgi:hypothetical protein